MRQVPKNPCFSITSLSQRKKKKIPIVMLTCYDYPSARIIANTTVDIVLVGDSLAMTVHGHQTTTTATMEMMQLHTEAVKKGLGHQLLLTDLPFLCHRISLADTMQNARRLIQAGAQALKIEGGDIQTCDSIHALVQAGIPIFGHIGLQPQTIHQLGGYHLQGKTERSARALIKDATRLEQAGISALVLECVPGTLAKEITTILSIPVIGIGAGPDTDGQVLVWHDMLGIQDDITPKFLKQFASLKLAKEAAITAYAEEVKMRLFPADCHTYNAKVIA